MRDLYNQSKAVALLHSVVVDATASISDIDLKDFNSALLLIDLGLDAGTGLSGSHKLVFTLQHADDDGTGVAGSYADVETKDMLGVTVSSGVILTVDSTSEDETLYSFGYVGGKRFLKLTYTETGTVSCPMTIILVKGHGTFKPAL